MQTGTEEISGLEETQQPELETETTAEVTQDEPTVKESPKDTVKRELEKLKNADGDSSESESQEQNQELSKKQPQQKLEKESDPDLAPPERLPDSQKGIFTKLPKGLRREANKLFRSYEASLTQANQYASEYKEIEEILKPHLPEWHERGFSKAKVIGQLVRAQAKLTDPDDEKRTKAFIDLAKSSKIDLSKLGNPQTESQNNNDPEITSLRNELQTLKSYVSTQQSEQNQGQTIAIVQELETVRQEIDETSGDYRYPELHNEAFLQQTVKPLVSAIKGTVSGISWADALRKAYSIATGKQPLDSQNGIQTRLPAANINKQSVRAIAPVLVRGRSISTSASSDNSPPPEALRDPRATAAWALDRIRRGG